MWATAVLIRWDEQAIVTFLRFSLVVWVIWLVPYFRGFFIPVLE